ncbi:MAG: ATP-binding protein [Deltaproteobacteria bacterium]|nr:ATP-binding protein [Deltaproteobacteria bacterium]
MAAKDRNRSEAGSREFNLSYLDAMCRWAECLVDHRTALDFGDDREEHVRSFLTGAEQAETEMASIAAQSRKAGGEVAIDALSTRYELSAAEACILRLSLVPSLDASFRKRIARFKDNVLLDYVDVDFLVSVLFQNRLDRLGARDLFVPTSRLVGGRLIRLSVPRDATSDTLPAQEVSIPDGVENFILGHEHVDKTIASLCRLTRPHASVSDLVMDEGVRDEALKVMEGRGLVMGLFGPPGTGKSLFADVAAMRSGRPLLTVDSARLSVEEGAFGETLDALFFDARMRGVILAFDNCETIFSQKNPRIPGLYEKLESHDGHVFLLTSDPRRLDPSLERYIAYQVEFEVPDGGQREALWRVHLEHGSAGPAKEVDIPGLALTFEFTGGQIRNAVAVARELASSRGAASVGQDDLTAGAWAQVRADMEEYSKKRRVRLTMDDLVLPKREKSAVEEVLDAARHKTFIMTRWGFGKRLATGKGLCCLFVGDPGTGKTLCAEILAEALGQNIYQISIPRVMSKYIGETEKNIERIFSTARANNSILLFDEADALFTKRVKVETSVDRFSNMEVNLLMQEIERFDGIVVLTTNLEKNMDKAFERRIQFKIRFPFPDSAHRTSIWRALIPRECPLADDIDWDLVGESFELSGGNIKNAILRAAYKAARDGLLITTDHIVSAAEAECRASGRLFRGLKREED